MLEPGLGLVGLMQVMAEGYADRPALGHRATERREVGGRCQRVVLPRYETITYGNLWARAAAVAAALRHEPVVPGDRIATLGAPSADHTAFEMAIAWLSAVSVPLHAGAPLHRLRTIVEETEPSVLACSTEHLDSAVALCGALPSIRRLVVFDHDPGVDDDRDAVEAAGERLTGAGARVVVETIALPVGRGSGLGALPIPAGDPERLAAIVYTSGSTGSPKGAMQSERLVSGAWAASAGAFVQRGFAIPAITLNQLPMSHTGGRSMLFMTLGAGGTAHFAGSNDLSTVLEDLALVRPTQLNFVPRVWELLHAEFQRRVARGRERDAVLAELRAELFGGRCIAALSGSAPISESLAAWVEELLDLHLVDALGATETGAVMADGVLRRPPITDYKLDDVPELGYFGTDRPHPRGELLVRSTTLFLGYYRRDDLTAEVFDDEGYYRTGDIVAEIAPDRFTYLDRRNNVVKLAQGEFVTISKLEALFEECEPVDQIYVYGNSERAYLLAVVVPTTEATERFGSDLSGVLLRSLQEAAAGAGLEPYEVPRDVIVEPSRFTVGNGLLTGVGKLARRELRDRYAERLEALYAAHDDARREEWDALVTRAARQPVLDSVREVVAAALGGLRVTPSAEDHFTDLGGDSLSALSCASLLSELLGVEVPVGVVISPANDLRAIARHVVSLRTHRDTRATFASVHGAGAKVVSASDLTLDRFLDESILASAPSLPDPVARPSHVLLTGATGYLGRYLALEWLERVASVGGTVTCLVRAGDDVSARARLDATFDTGDDELLGRYHALEAHLEVVAGDKSEVSLGLDGHTWKRLAEEIDLIVDSAALVNHMLAYPHLFGPNVVGTAELLRLALTVRRKQIVYVSSVAAGQTAAPGSFTEDADIRQVCPTKRVDDSYANGYATSKWAGEVLLREAHDRCALPVSVFRCDMLMAETRYRGQLNLPDMVTRLLFSIAVTGLAPRSFYLPGVDGGRSRAHFDGLPVDFVAEAISTIGCELAPDHRTYHVVNPHDDGIGLDEYVDWMIEAGRPIERIDSYEAWHDRFASSLRNLPEQQRQASLLPIVESFRRRQASVRGSSVMAARFAAAVAAHGIADGRIPGIGKACVQKYLTDLEHVGLL
jgi:fatty acid CoA ligase FadD9